jgi:hypothetical protein
VRHLVVQHDYRIDVAPVIGRIFRIAERKLVEGRVVRYDRIIRCPRPSRREVEERLRRSGLPCDWASRHTRCHR